MEEIEILNEIHSLLDCTLMDYASLTCEYLFKIDIIWFLLALLFLRRNDTRVISITLILSLLLDLCICYSLKIWIDRPRPMELYEVDALITDFHTGSFPSGHTAGAFCAATVIFIFDRYKGFWLFILALFIGLTRMYLYAHFPTDVLGGAALGILSALAVFYTYHRSSLRTVFVEAEDSKDTS